MKNKNPFLLFTQGSPEVAHEIERKFLIKSLPENFSSFPSEKIAQGYLEINENGEEKRIRSKDGKFFATKKIGQGAVRKEFEIEITKEQFDYLWPETEGKRIYKTRYKIPHQDNTIELDIYDGDLSSLIVVEVEFKDLASAQSFNAPEWFDEEITENKAYKNSTLAVQGLPKNTPENKIPRYELEDGLKELINQVEEKISKSDSPLIVEIAGGSASGKTSAVAAKLKEAFNDQAIIISLDDYYRGKAYYEQKAKEGININWDQPEALDLELAKENLAKIKSGLPIDEPIYSFKESARIGYKKIEPSKVVIVEGLFALNNILKDEGDIRVFVDIGTHGRILRRLMRDIERAGQKPAEILSYFSEIVEDMHEKHVQSTLKNADMVISNEYNPNVEAYRSGAEERQIKFQAKIDAETLRKLGADRLGSSTQIDTYYNPRDRDLLQTGEMLRIRDEGTHKLLTYKGVVVEGEYRQRPKFEFEIDADTEKKFLRIYGDSVKVIKKDRAIYQLNGIIFSLDNVEKIVNGNSTNLGEFLELRVTKDSNPDQIRSLLQKLGIDIKSGIKKSYFEM